MYPSASSIQGTYYDDRNAYVCEDANYLSARWPGDAYLLGKTFLRKLLALPK
jgi:hypothetical protein